MTPTVGLTLRLPADEYDALEKTAGRGGMTQFLRALLRLELQKRGVIADDDGTFKTTHAGTSARKRGKR